MTHAQVISIGTFDGVHRGHAALLHHARRLADRHQHQSGQPCAVRALVFDPHPLSALNPGAEPPRLTSFDSRASLLKLAGADRVDRLSADTLDHTAEGFIASLCNRDRVIAFVEGPDFRFGKGRAGDVDLLHALGSRLGFACHVVPPVMVTLDDHAESRASSTITRWLLRHGRVRDAALVLGRPYALEGRVVQGDRRGRTIGFPTANVHTDLLAPGDGVYAARATLPDGSAFPAAVNIGPRPTFDGTLRPTIEAHLLDAPDRSGNWSPLPGVSEYGWAIRLELLAFLRDVARFPSVAALVQQLHRDCERARRTFRQPEPDLSDPNTFDRAPSPTPGPPATPQHSQGAA